MKNISLALNIVLLIAVGFLYYKQFSGGKNFSSATVSAPDSSGTSSPVIVPVINSAPKDVRIVFVNADSIFEKYTYARKTKAAGEGRVENYKRNYQDKVAAFQKEYTDYTEKAGAGGYTKEQGLAIEAGLQKKRDEIVAMEQNQSNVLEDVEKINADVQKRIYDYLSRFNKEHGYYCVFAYTKSGGGVLGVDDSMDVTAQVIAGLNNEYNSGKGK
ncbi:MAG: OmpH family outer membrane protein [Bacteroidetes bacterium]|nr:OmpH family outer membrane protein [Bacteroidota bacterium]